MKKLLLVLLCALALCGCSEAPQRMTEAELAAWKAYHCPKLPGIQSVSNTDALQAAFGSVAPGAKLIDYNVKGWHKVQIVLDYPGGVPDGWEDMLAALSDGSAQYEDHSSAELVTSRGALLATASGGLLRYDVFENVRQPAPNFTHEEDLSAYTDRTFYISSKNRYYHLDGLCSELNTRAYYAVDVNTAVDAREDPCPVCAANVLPPEILNVKRASLTPEPVQPEPIEEVLPNIEISNDEKYVWVSKTGSKYHSTSLCSNIDVKNAKYISLSEAKSQGKTPCSNCW